MPIRTDKLERFLVVEADTDEGPCVFVTVSPVEVVRKHGLIPLSIVGKLRPTDFSHSSIEPENFIPNGVFRDFMQDIIATLAPQEDAFRLVANQRRGGLIVVTDGRTPTPEGPVPPEDIIGVFKIPESASELPTYEPSPNHRLLTQNGFFQLPGDLHQRLLDRLATMISET